MALTSGEINIDVALSSILPTNHTPIQLPDNAKDISLLLGKDGAIYKNLRLTAVYLRRGQELKKGMLEQVAAWLQALYGLELLNPRYKVNSEIDRALELVMNPACRFPYPYPEIAEAVLKELNDANWGEEESDEEMESNSAVPVATSPTFSTPAAQNATQSTTVTAADNDPIFGANGIMHDINIARGQRKSYNVSINWHKPSAKVFGHNGFEVGTVWPRLIAAFRDGAHGHTMQGICGNARDGCWSIVVSGFYEGIDEDHGYTIYYSDSKARTNKANLPEQNRGTDALRRSIHLQNPVRVLRGKGSNWSGSPRAGLRYDGLYRVVSESTNKNKLGGGFIQFKLRRMMNNPKWSQPDIVQDAPDQAMVALINRVENGITRRR